MTNRIRFASAFFLLLLPVVSFASYTVIMKDGQRYRAKQKWTVTGGKAIVTLESGQTLSLDPNLINVQESEKVNSQGMDGARVIANPDSGAPVAPTTSPLGSITIKRPSSSTSSPATTPTPSNSKPTTASAASGSTNLSNNVIQLFSDAYENVGFFDSKIAGNGPNRLHITMTADNEDQVFKALSATAFMMTKIPTATGEKVEVIDLFLKTINGGSGGRFQMTQTDAADLAKDTQNKWKDYYIRKVIF